MGQDTKEQNTSPQPEQPAGEQDDSSQSPKESDIGPKAFEKRKPVFDPTGRVENINPDETKIADIRQHPFGLFVIYVQAIVSLGLALFLILSPFNGAVKSLGINQSSASAVIWLFVLLAVTLVIIYMILATRIYHSHQLIVTDSNITQVLQVGLFDRKVSEVSMADVEDVTARQKGIFPTIFGYGTLKVETAGEQNNFIFRYCPNPSAYAKALQDARSRYLHNPTGSRNNPPQTAAGP